MAASKPSRSTSSTKIAGRVKEILVDEGDFVTAGQVLAHMDTGSWRRSAGRPRRSCSAPSSASRPPRAWSRSARPSATAAVAVVAQREAELDAARATAGAIARSWCKSDTVSQQVLDDDRRDTQGAKAAVSAAEAQVAASEAAIGAAKSQVVDAEARRRRGTRRRSRRIKADIDDSALKSPRDGRVQYRVAQPGEVLAAGGRVLNMVDLSDVYMTFFLPTAQAGRVAHRQPRCGSCSTPRRNIVDSRQGHVRRRRRPVHAQDRGDRGGAPEADVPHQGADLSGAAARSTFSRSRPACPAWPTSGSIRKAEWPARLQGKLLQ